jgi:hypothetical protein
MGESNFRYSDARGGLDRSRDPGSKNDVTPRRCCFPDALDARTAGCGMAIKASRQYRRVVYCADARSHGTCWNWLDRTRKAARFFLGTPRSPSALPRRKAIKLQCGGLLGIGDLMEKQPVRRVENVCVLLRRALARYGSFDRVPLETVVKRVHEFDADDR